MPIPEANARCVVPWFRTRFSGLRLSRVMGSTPSIDLQDAAIRCKLKDMRVLTDAIEDGGQAMDINEQDDGLGYSALTEAVKSMHIVGSKKRMIKMYEFILDEKKADIQLLTKADESPCIWATLVESGPHVNCSRHQGR